MARICTVCPSIDVADATVSTACSSLTPLRRQTAGAARNGNARPTACETAPAPSSNPLGGQSSYG
eukprot:5441793-Prymnesium_polylepis.1